MNIAEKLLGPNTGLAELMRGLFERLPSERDEHGEIDPRHWEEALIGPARDILSRSGKGVRARLIEHAWHLAGGAPGGPPEELPVLIELLHAGSLIIDDIEDDSSMRRGAPALHRLYGVPVAINTANWLYFLSLTLLFRVELDANARLALYEDISLGLLRCHKGQALDLTVNITRVPKQQVPALVARSTRLKTGSLMEMAATIGAHGAGAPPPVVAALGGFGAAFGVGLQMIDDWSGLNNRERLDKGIEDIRNTRPTWPWAWLAETCDDVTYAGLARQAGAASIDWDAEQVIGKMRGALIPTAKERIVSQLQRALADLRGTIGDTPWLRELGEEVHRLESAYG
jgi:geranylgeranyl pyrophosphate synthase